MAVIVEVEARVAAARGTENGNELMNMKIWI